MKKFLKTVIFLLAAGGAGAAITCAGDEDFNQRVYEAAFIAAAWVLAGLLYSFYRQMPDKKPAAPAPTQEPLRRHPRIDIFDEEE